MKKKDSYFGILKGKLEISRDFDKPDLELIELIQETLNDISFKKQN